RARQGDPRPAPRDREAGRRSPDRARAQGAPALALALGDVEAPDAHLVGGALAPVDRVRRRVVVAALEREPGAGIELDRVLEEVGSLLVEVPVRDREQRLLLSGLPLEDELRADAEPVHVQERAVDLEAAAEVEASRGRAEERDRVALDGDPHVL